MARAKSNPTKNNGAKLGFEQTLWAAADKLRGNMDPSEYKHDVLGLIFLKYISDAFNEHYERLKADKESDPEDRDEYVAKNIFCVTPAARWSKLQAEAKLPSIGKTIDNAMVAIEKENPTLKGVLPKNFNRPELDKRRLGELIDLIGTIGLGDKENRSKDILGRVYEYFLSQNPPGPRAYRLRQYVACRPWWKLHDLRAILFHTACSSWDKDDQEYAAFAN